MRFFLFIFVYVVVVVVLDVMVQYTDTASPIDAENADRIHGGQLGNKQNDGG